MQTHFSFLAQQFQLFKQPVAILDLEATGGNLYQDRITEIAYLKFNGNEIKEIQQLINPQTPISPFIANLTGIDNNMVAHAPTFAQIAHEIAQDLRGCLILAHNSKFDYTLLINEFARAGVDFATSALCTVKLSKKLYPHEYKHNLDTIAERFQLPIAGDRHRAMTDVLLLSEFVQRATHDHPETWFAAANSLAFPPRIPQNLPPRLQHDLAHLGDGYGVAIWADAHGNTLAARVYERGFANAIADLKADFAQKAHTITWHSALGFLDALDFCLQNQLNIETPFMHKRYTVDFVLKNGCLKAEIVRLKNGIFDTPPNGIFMHIKAAEKALNAWAKSENLCLNLLGINPHKLPENAPCPAAQIGKCSTACHNQDCAAHNLAVQAALARFPHGDWHWYNPIEIIEKNEVSGSVKIFHCERGALYLPNGKWYRGNNLLDFIKKLNKENRHAIRMIAPAKHD